MNPADDLVGNASQKDKDFGSSNAETGISFTVDRSRIPTVPQDDQNSELYNLGIDIYEQRVLEEQILHQVDEVLEKQNWKNDCIELMNMEENCQSLDNEEKSQQNINVEIINSFDNEVLNISESNGLCAVEATRKVTETPRTSLLHTSRNVGKEELSSVSIIEKYLRYQMAVEEKMKKKNLKRKSDNKSKSMANTMLNVSSSLKKKIFIPEKRRKKEFFGTNIGVKISRMTKNTGKLVSEVMPLSNSTSGSEYCPSESEISEFEKEIKIKTLKTKRSTTSKVKKMTRVEDWCTDDSDWEYSDDEKHSKRKSKLGKKEQDDGNLDHYLQRLSRWEKISNREDIETQVKILDDEFKIPLLLWNKLFNYQKVGVQWLWELNKQRCGGILGDEMGLGKTVQVIAFLAGLSVSKLVSRHGSFKGLGPVLIVCPTTVMHQWVKEVHYWWPQFRVALMHESGNFTGKRSKLILEIVKSKGILVTSFLGCVQQIDTLICSNWHYVILDEGHKIRNPDSQVTKAVKKLRTPHRLILSGSPMQNNLKELWSLFDFIFPGKLGTLPVFLSEFAVPITQGGYANASQVQVATAYKCASVLRDTIAPYLLRRVKEDVKRHINLPQKNEQVLFCKLTDEQRDLYKEYLNSNEVNSILSGRYKIFVGLINLRKICNHPHLYSGGPKLFKWDNVDLIPVEERFGYWKKAGKMIVVETLLKIWKKQDHRVLIFSQSKQMLHIIESFIQLQGYTYLKLDGSTSIGSRQPIITKFNEDKQYFIFLSTTHVGGLGVNLTGADRVIIYDPDWNPATDTQARERAWRIGQMNQVTIYRLVTSGTIEEKIYHRQIFKQFLTNKVLKDPKQRRFFKSNDLYELFTLKEIPGEVTETSAIFAGSGSEVNMKTVSWRLKANQAKRKLAIEAVKLKRKNSIANILGREKVENMMKLAKILSQKIGNGVDAAYDGTEKVSSNGLSLNDNSKSHKSTPATLTESLLSKSHKNEEKILKKREKKENFDTFEGEIVPHLVKKLGYQEFMNRGDSYREEQDDYILKKLFSKSGIQNALQHDHIVEGGPADYALVEGEAEKTAKEAVEALKKSRREYFQTVGNALSQVKPRFGSRHSKRKMNIKVDFKQDTPRMTSSELLCRINDRNFLLSDGSNNLENDRLKEHLVLLTDIRNFVAFETNVNNVASTQEILDKFRDRLPTDTSPLFRALLLEICDFHRDSQGQGIWRLKTEFRW